MLVALFIRHLFFKKVFVLFLCSTDFPVLVLKFATMKPAQPQRDYGLLVAARVRPFNQMEIDATQDDEPVPIVEETTKRGDLAILDPAAQFREKANFNFDFVFTPFQPSVQLQISEQEEDPEGDVMQEQIYEKMGAPIMNAAWEGYNGCIFAYGQTSSGKTYTMMGTKRNPGVIPRLCRSLFERVEGEMLAEGSKKITKCTVSYMEIYNEQVRDLLRKPVKQHRFASRFDSKDDNSFQNLKVRSHPIHGPFVDGVEKIDVDNWLECVKLIRAGNELRSSCATNMNSESSRSHAIFQIVLTQVEALGAKVRGKEVSNHRVSKINLVDLAGSERIARTNVTGKHLAEANSINQSLSTLRKVFDALIQKSKKPGQVLVIPYRESMLTWILSDNFGGNSRTMMIANVSPHESNVLESESTLRYATLARGIINRVRVNEDPAAKLVKELQTQLKMLQDEVRRQQDGTLTSLPDEARTLELEAQIEENRMAMEELHAREEGMRQLIQESRLREEQLIAERETLASSEEKWRNEAHKLRMEKEELQKTINTIAQGNPAMLLKNNTKKEEFWVPGAESKPDFLEDIGVTDIASEKSTDKVHEPSKPKAAPQPSRRSPPPPECESPAPQYGRRAGASAVSTPVATIATSAGGPPRAGRRAKN